MPKRVLSSTQNISIIRLHPFIIYSRFLSDLLSAKHVCFFLFFRVEKQQAILRADINLCSMYFMRIYMSICIICETSRCSSCFLFLRSARAVRCVLFLKSFFFIDEYHHTSTIPIFYMSFWIDRLIILINLKKNNKSYA